MGANAEGLVALSRAINHVSRDKALPYRRLSVIQQYPAPVLTWSPHRAFVLQSPIRTLKLMPGLTTD